MMCIYSFYALYRIKSVKWTTLRLNILTLHDQMQSAKTQNLLYRQILVQFSDTSFYEIPLSGA